MGPMVINNDRLAANKGTSVVEDVNEEAKFEEDEEEEENTKEAHTPHPQIFHFLLQELPTFGTHHNLVGGCGGKSTIHYLPQP